MLFTILLHPRLFCNFFVTDICQLWYLILEYDKILFKQKIVSVIDRLVKEQNRVEAIYVRHDDGLGEALTRGTEGYEIYDAFKSLET